MKSAAVLAMLTAFLCGCSTVESTKKGGHHMVSIKNMGWQFLNFIPLASGDIHHPDTCSTEMFSDTVSLKNNITILDSVVKKSGARGFRHLSSSLSEENVLFILFSRRTMHTSAELVYDGTQAE